MKKTSSLLVLLALIVTSVPTFVLSSNADEADGSLPDLTAENLTFTEYVDEPGTYIVEVDYQNIGTVDVDPATTGSNVTTLNGVTEATYGWSALADLDFLLAGGESLGVRAFADVPALTDGDEIEVCVDAGDAVVESDETNNCVSYTFGEEDGLPDLMADNLRFEDRSADGDGSALEALVDYQNVGTVEVDPSTESHNEATINGVIETSYSWTTLGDLGFLSAGGESSGMRLFASAPSFAAGDVVEVCVDADDLVVESDETNNCVSYTFPGTEEEEEEEGTVDLSVSNVQFVENEEIPGTYNVYADFANAGNVDVDSEMDNGNNRATLNDGEETTTYSWSTLDESVLDFLTAGGETLELRVFSSAIALTDGDEIEVCVDADDAVTETDEGNNCITETFGDAGADEGDDEGEEDEEEEESTFVVEAGPDQSVDSSSPVITLTTQAYVQGLSGGDMPEVTISWGDGTTESAVLVVSNPIYITGTHTYSEASVSTTYTVTVCADDREGGVVLQSLCDTFTVSFTSSDGSPYYGGSSGSSGGSGGGNSSDNEPDLSVEDIYLQSDGDIVAVIGNIGDQDVSSNDEVRIELSIDDDEEWSRDYDEDDDEDFFEEDEESEINMGDLLEDEDEEYEVKVCVDTEDEVEEQRESNNCRTEYLSIEDDAGDDDDVTLSSEASEDEDEDHDESCEEGYFYDIHGHWAEDEICDLYDREVVKGRKRHYYIPNDSVTRAEFLKIALLNAELDVEAIPSGDDYLDVDSNDWYYEYVTFATDLGIVDGDDGRFYPDQAITRAEAMAILVRLELDGDELDELLDEDYDSNDIDFDDVDDDDWFAPYIVYGDEEGLIEGYDNGTFRPASPITRAEAAEIADNLYDNRY